MTMWQTGWVIAYGLILGLISLYGIHRYIILYLFLKYRRSVPEKPGAPVEWPVVTVQLPVYNERWVVRRLLRAVEKLDYPRDRLEIQVLDDSTDETTEIAREEIARLRAAGLDAHLIRREDRVGYKAGALANGMRQARGELLYVLDADFVPEPGNLRAMVPYFSDPGVGMVQARWGHLNRGFSPLTRVQAILLDGHFLLEQTARSRSGRFFHFNGTAGLWRRSCVEGAGGWEHDTLTEDLDLSFRAQLRGWRFVYLRQEVTPAELPMDMRGFKSQQHRWTKGAIQNARKLLGPVLRSRASWKVKLEAATQLTCNFIYLLAALLCLLLLLQPAIAWDEWWAWGPSMMAFACATVSVIIYYAFSSHGTGERRWWIDLLHLPLLLAVGLGMCVSNTRAILEALFTRDVTFERTPKYGNRDRFLAQQRRRANAGQFPWISVVELGLSWAFALKTVAFLAMGNWVGALFPLLCTVGFGFVGFPAMGRWVSRWFERRPAGGLDGAAAPSEAPGAGG